MSGWSLARIRGVDLKVHFSFVFLLVYLMLVAGSQFQNVILLSGVELAEIRGGSFVWSLIFSLALCVSIVLHEFGHVWMAQRQGVRVQSVTLMMLGGVSEMGKIPDQKFSELKISIVGPLVSFGIAALLFLLQRKSSSAPVVLFSYWLCRVNLALGVFNLIPAYPMDGGRVLRSLLQVYQGKVRALHNTVKVAQGLAWVFGFLGLLSFNFILVLIGVFVYAAAVAEEALSLNEALLKDVKVGEFVDRTIVLHESDKLRDVAREFVRSQMRALPVQTQNGKPAIVSLLRLREVPSRYWGEVSVKAVLDHYEKNLSIDTPLEEVFTEVVGLGALPIAEQGRLIGVIQARRVSDFLDFKRILQDEEFSSQKAA